MKKLLIVNADDYGQATGINIGIIEGHLRGIITSTTIMASGRALNDGLARLKDTPNLGLGCHLVLIGEEPVAKASQIRSLVNSKGEFPKTLTDFMWLMTSGQAKYSEIVTELRAQLDKLFNLGLTISHCDSHKHSHAHPKVLDAVIQVVEEYKINYIRKPFEKCKIKQLRQMFGKYPSLDISKKYLLSRMLDYYHSIFLKQMSKTSLHYPDYFQGFIATGSLTPEIMPKLLAGLSDGVTELMCHPARLDEDLNRTQTRLKQSRESELSAVMSDEAFKVIKSESIELTSFRQLAKQLF
ncbi:MAG: ChbG/HpnK family deacetylase [Acidobacteria bacterium]|nr:ChbG/HpnK family deacetylase [Acidobacteriota bacterium]